MFSPFDPRTSADGGEGVERALELFASLRAPLGTA
jgi:hypothetical protein